jgi:NADPH:quinone reductase-like Zn-dependent oxidoreductase
MNTLENQETVSDKQDPGEAVASFAQLQLTAFGNPAEVVQLQTRAVPVLGADDVLVALEAAPLNQSDFLLVRGTYGIRPPLPARAHSTNL